MEMDRRTLLTAGALPLASLPLDAGWDRIAEQYDVTRDVVQLEHGNWGMMARPVLAAYRAFSERVNRDTSFYARRTMVADLEAVRARVAAAMGVAPDEVALTRNATEALRALILGYNRLKPGDTVIYADLDYDSMQACVEALATRRGARLVKLALPEPARHETLIQAYSDAFAANPSARLLLLTHLSHRTGLVLPVRAIADAARARGIDTIVDAAHSFGQLDFTLPDLGADFVGVNLHKWVGAPIGAGALHIRRDRIADIDSDPAEDGASHADIRSRVHIGTFDYAAHLAIPAALDFQVQIGAGPRAARLRALRDRWAEALRGDTRFEILTPADPRLAGAITSFRLRGKTSHADNVALARRLLDEHRIFTVHRDGLASGSCVRVTPALATRVEEVDRLVTALRAIAA
jgi:selenocysteine lyase/cysteine desulfurase